MADRPEQHRLGGRPLIASPASNSTSVGPQLSIEKRHVFLGLLWVGDVGRAPEDTYQLGGVHFQLSRGVAWIAPDQSVHIRWRAKASYRLCDTAVEAYDCVLD
jgi:hypothetical protein